MIDDFLPSPTTKFSGLRSRWMYEREWRNSILNNNWSASIITVLREKRVSQRLNRSSRLGPRNSIIIMFPKDSLPYHEMAGIPTKGLMRILLPPPCKWVIIFASLIS